MYILGTGSLCEVEFILKMQSDIIPNPEGYLAYSEVTPVMTEGVLHFGPHCNLHICMYAISPSIVCMVVQ
jgi:hypothetical protein